MRDLATILDDYHRTGFARLGPAVDASFLADLRARADAIMLGEIVHEGLFFQHDAGSGRYEDLELRKGWVGPSRDYRKIEKLEKDPLFRRLIDWPAYEPVVRALIHDEVAFARAFARG